MQIIKRPYVQLGILVFIYLLYLVILGQGMATNLFIVLLICAVYIMFYERQHKFTNWLRVALYAIIIYNIYYILRSLPTEIHVVRLFESDISGLDLMRRIYVDYYWYLLFIAVITLTLVMNHRKKPLLKI